jgi:tetrahydromethanopterin S-methyltransferase subunit G
MIELPIKLLEVAITIIFGALSTLLGLLYRNHKRRLSGVEQTSESNEDRLDTIEEKVGTVFAWAFGNEEDATDRGISQDIDDSFEELNESLERLEADSERRHEELVGRFDQLIDELHDEEALEFERGDLE